MSESSNLRIGISANDTASAELKALQTTVQSLGQALQQLGIMGANASAASAASIQRETTAIKEKIAALNQEIATKQQSSTSAVRASMVEAEYINRNVDLVARQAQARIAASNASAAAQKQAVEDAARYEAESINRTLAVKEAAFRKELAAHNAKIYKERELEDAAAARAAASALGGALTLTPATGFGRATSELAGVKSSYLSAAESARVFQQELGVAGQGITLAHTQKTIDTIQGLNREILSAKESARVFQQELGATGQGIALAHTQKTIDTIHGLNREMLSAKASAEVFNRELGKIGSGLTLIPAAGFGRRLEEQVIGIRPQLDPTARAQMQRQLEMTFAELEPVAELEGVVVGKAFTRGMGGGVSSGAGLLQRESRHIIGLFDSLARGQRGQAISSIGAAARDAGFGIGALSASMTGLIALMGGAAIIHGAESMGRWAGETRAAASAAGMSIENYSRLQGALVLTGEKANEADTVLKRLAVNLSAALADPASLAAQAFHNLGISQEDLVKTGGDVSKVVDLLASAFARTADGANKSANFNEVAGRSFEKLFQLIQDGNMTLDQAKAKAAALGLTLTEETAAGLEKTGRKADELFASIRGQGIRAFEAWGGAIRNVLSILEALGVGIGVVAGQISSLTKGLTGALSSPFESYPDHVKRMMAQLHPSAGGGKDATATGATGGDKTQVPPLIRGGEATVLDQMRLDVARAREMASRSATTSQSARIAEDKAEIAVMQQTLSNAKLTGKQREEVEKDLANAQTALRNSTLNAGTAAAKQSTTDYIAQEKEKIAAADGSAAKILAIYDEMLSNLGTKYKASAAQIANIEREKVQEVNKARLSELKESFQQQDQATRLSELNLQLSQAQGRASGQRPTETSLKTKAAQDISEAQVVEQTAQQRIAALQEVMSHEEQGSALQKQTAQEIMNITLTSKQQEIELYNKAGEAAEAAAKKSMEIFTKFFDSMGSAFETFSGSLVKALIAPQQELIKAGLTTIKHSMRGSEIQQAFSSMATNMLSSLGKSVEEAIGSTIAKALSGGAADTIGQLLSQTFSKLLGNITGGAIGSAVGGATSSVAGSVPIVTAVTTGSASIVSAITAAAAAQEALLTSISVQQPSALGFSLAGGGIIPSAQSGMVLGGGGTLAILHPREMVLPSQLSQGIQQMIQRGGGGSNANLNFSPTINNNSRGRGGTGLTRAEFSQMLSLHSGSMLGEARNMMRSGWRPA